MIQSLAYWIVLAGAVAIYWWLPARFRTGFLFMVSAAYLATLAPLSVAMLIVLACSFRLLSPLLVRDGPVGFRVLAGLVLGASLVLSIFKLIPLLQALAGASPAAIILIPLGLSYYIFKLIHYAIEVARENIVPPRWDEYLCWLFLLPIFTAGPIERYDHFLANRRDRPDRRMFIQGGTRIVIGIIKIGFVSEVVRRILGFQIDDDQTLLAHLQDLSTLKTWLIVLRSYLLVYIGFSAYTDIAIGSSRLFGIEIMENFNLPILATNISIYWRRWHMTLSGWCQTYVYMPVLGYTRNPYIALNASFFVMGMWHSATATRLLWGLWHAWGSIVFMIWMRYRRKARYRLLDRKFMLIPAWVMTQAYIVASWAILIGESQGIHDGVRVLAKLVAIDLPR